MKYGLSYIASYTGRIAPPGYPNTTSTLCLRIISLKIWPPVSPTRDLSSLLCFFVPVVPCCSGGATETLKLGEGSGLRIGFFSVSGGRGVLLLLLRMRDVVVKVR